MDILIFLLVGLGFVVVLQSHYDPETGEREWNKRKKPH